MGKKDTKKNLQPIKSGQVGANHPRTGKKVSRSPGFHKKTVRSVMVDVLMGKYVANTQIVALEGETDVSMSKVTRDKRKLPRKLLETFVENLAYGAIIVKDPVDKRLLTELIKQYMKVDPNDHSSEQPSFTVNIGTFNQAPGICNESDYADNVIELSDFVELAQNKDEAE